MGLNKNGEIVHQSPEEWMPFEFHKPTTLMLASSNGAGKSTLFVQRVAHLFSVPFINAGVSRKEVLRDPSVEAFYKTVQIPSE